MEKLTVLNTMLTSRMSSQNSRPNPKPYPPTSPKKKGKPYTAFEKMATVRFLLQTKELPWSLMIQKDMYIEKCMALLDDEEVYCA